MAATASMSPWPAATTWPRLASHRPEAAAHLPLCWPDLVAWPPWDPTPSRACLLAVLLPCPRHHCRPVFSRPCFRLARFEPFALAAQLTGPGSSGRIHSQCSCCLLRSRSLEYIGAVFLHLPVPVALTRSLFSRYLGAHHPTPFPGSRSSSGGAHQITQVLSFSPSSLQSRLIPQRRLVLCAFCWPASPTVVSLVPVRLLLSLVCIYPPVICNVLTYELSHPTPPTCGRTHSVFRTVVRAQTVRDLRDVSCLLH